MSSRRREQRIAVSFHPPCAHSGAGREDVVIQKIRSYVSFENEAFAIAALAFPFCGAVILGFM
jgi:hypothetical protein